MPHDESMKFVMRKNNSDEMKDNLFKYAKMGPLRVFDNQDCPQFNYKVDKNQLAGRQSQIHNILKFLNGSQEKRICIINGEADQGCSHLAKYSIKYTMDRGQIKQGSYYIDTQKIISVTNLMHVLQKKLDLHSDLEGILDAISRKDMLFCFDNCTTLLEKDGDNIISFLSKFTDMTISPKVIIIVNMRSIDKLQGKLDRS